ncbi:putative E3 ubiquitin-protein ligase [Paratrimastix pyriformis]|uniref:E3 ubiquitin-protein ligase n=1 Tax=Paratrimastix pyriformis TaxID=342808 RepID=A0ABQ8UMF3_9EUKA|nr:putative E3 ubiquitin-protein ligase [Paratrimastix pyriformis]
MSGIFGIDLEEGAAGVVENFTHGISSLLLPVLETCNADTAAVFSSQEQLLQKLKFLSTQIEKLSEVRKIPPLAPYTEKLKTCRKRITAISSALGNIQSRIQRMQATAREQLSLQPHTKLNSTGTPLAKLPLAKLPLAKLPLAKLPLAKLPLAKLPLAKLPLATPTHHHLPLTSAVDAFDYVLGQHTTDEAEPPLYRIYRNLKNICSEPALVTLPSNPPCYKDLHSIFMKQAAAGTSSINPSAPIIAKDLHRIGGARVSWDHSSVSGRMLALPHEEIRSQSNFASIRADCCVYGGKWMYEVSLRTSGLMQLGWCTLRTVFTHENGVGDDRHSYAYDGKRIKTWNGRDHPYGEQWAIGDVIGICIDLTDQAVPAGAKPDERDGSPGPLAPTPGSSPYGKIEFFRNGTPLGIAFQNVARDPELAYFPGVSLGHNEKVSVNFGARPFRYPVPGYQPLQPDPPPALMACARYLCQSWARLAYLELHQAAPEVPLVAAAPPDPAGAALPGVPSTEERALLYAALFEFLAPLLAEPLIAATVLLPSSTRPPLPLAKRRPGPFQVLLHTLGLYTDRAELKVLVDGTMWTLSEAARAFALMPAPGLVAPRPAINGPALAAYPTLPFLQTATGALRLATHMLAHTAVTPMDLEHRLGGIDLSADPPPVLTPSTDPPPVLTPATDPPPVEFAHAQLVATLLLPDIVPFPAPAPPLSVPIPPPWAVPMAGSLASCPSHAALHVLDPGLIYRNRALNPRMVSAAAAHLGPVGPGQPLLRPPPAGRPLLRSKGLLAQVQARQGRPAHGQDAPSAESAGGCGCGGDGAGADEAGLDEVIAKDEIGLLHPFLVHRGWPRLPAARRGGAAPAREDLFFDILRRPLQALTSYKPPAPIAAPGGGDFTWRRTTRAAARLRPTSNPRLAGAHRPEAPQRHGPVVLLDEPLNPFEAELLDMVVVLFYIVIEPILDQVARNKEELRFQLSRLQDSIGKPADSSARADALRSVSLLIRLTQWQQVHTSHPWKQISLQHLHLYLSCLLERCSRGIPTPPFPGQPPVAGPLPALLSYVPEFYVESYIYLHRHLTDPFPPTPTPALCPPHPCALWCAPMLAPAALFREQALVFVVRHLTDSRFINPDLQRSLFLALLGLLEANRMVDCLEGLLARGRTATAPELIAAGGPERAPGGWWVEAMGAEAAQRGISLYADVPPWNGPELDELTERCLAADESLAHPAPLRPLRRDHVRFVHQLLVSFSERTWVYAAQVLLTLWKGDGMFKVGFLRPEAEKEPFSAGPGVDGPARGAAGIFNVLFNQLNYTVTEMMTGLRALRQGRIPRDDHMYLERKVSVCLDLCNFLLRLLECTVLDTPELFLGPAYCGHVHRHPHPHTAPASPASGPLRPSELVLGADVNRTRLVEAVLMVMQQLGPGANEGDLDALRILAKSRHLETEQLTHCLVAILATLFTFCSAEPGPLFESLASTGSLSLRDLRAIGAVPGLADLQRGARPAPPEEQQKHGDEAELGASASTTPAFPPLPQARPVVRLADYEALLGALEAYLEASKAQSGQQAAGPAAGANEEEGADNLCAICYVNPVDTTFLPCKHRSCHVCIARQMMNKPRCFFCNAQIADLQRDDDHQEPDA